jgi:hypothetical protein
MRTITIYQFDELTEESKQKAIDNFKYGDNQFDYIWNDAQETLKNFNENIAYMLIRMNNQDLTGFRLRKWILNNLYNDLFKPKFIGNINKIVKHKRLKNKYYKNGNVSSNYYSAINVNDSCVLTGVCYDDDILKPIYDFLNNPCEHTTFKDLINECKDSLNNSVEKEINWYYTDEGKTEHLSQEDYVYSENGTLLY